MKKRLEDKSPRSLCVFINFCEYGHDTIQRNTQIRSCVCARARLEPRTAYQSILVVIKSVWFFFSFPLVEKKRNTKIHTHKLLAAEVTIFESEAIFFLSLFYFFFITRVNELRMLFFFLFFTAVWCVVVLVPVPVFISWSFFDNISQRTFNFFVRLLQSRLFVFGPEKTI